jgi:hypothetical protein
LERATRHAVSERLNRLFRQVDSIVSIWEHPELGPPESDAEGPVLRVLQLWQEMKEAVDHEEEWTAYPNMPADAVAVALLDKSLARLDGIYPVALRQPGIDSSALDNQAEPLAQAALDFLELFTQAQPSGNLRFERAFGRLHEGFQREVSFDQMRRAAAAVKAAETAAATAESAAQNSRKAAGETGSLNLAEHFETYRKSERTAAEWLRVLAVSVVAVAVIVVMRLPHEDLSIADVLQRALIAVPIFGLAGYLAAEAGRHRRASQWAATLKVQLLTVDAYVDPLGATEAAEIRQHLARRAFGELPTTNSSGKEGVEDVPMPTGLQAVLDRLLAELKSKPEK